ncbi:MAG: DUF6473 family protein [Pseudomonadota bacterium]
MNYVKADYGGLDYFPCRYGTSKLLFRGPRRRMDGDYVAFLGGTETYGKFIDAPFPALTEVETGLRSINLGCVNAGLDVYHNDTSLLEICNHARATVIQVMGAQNMTNRFYAVHPRRNDRFLKASQMLEAIYPDVDFTDFSFTRHLVQSLAEISFDKFLILVEELKEAWVGRMRSLLSQIDGPVVLLWMSDKAPSEVKETDPEAQDPVFVDRAMIDALSDLSPIWIEVAATEIERYHGLEEMYFAEPERAAAEEMLGPLVHQRTAKALAPVLTQFATAPPQ